MWDDKDIAVAVGKLQHIDELMSIAGPVTINTTTSTLSSSILPDDRRTYEITPDGICTKAASDITHKAYSPKRKHYKPKFTL